MTLAIQAFRMGAEPFFFKQSQQQNAKKSYAMIMDFFNLICGFIFTFTIFLLPIIKNIIHPSYHEGLIVVPILLLANWFLGVYYNSSIWYKLTDQTIKGGYLSIFGAVITIIGNLILIPILGYLGAALVTLSCYFLMTLASLFWGQKHFFVPYNYTFLIIWPVVCVIFTGICWNFNSIWISLPLLFLFLIFSIFAIKNRLNFWEIKIPFLTK
jgi:O-antigen/teichoic acid export membrane protein